MQYTLAGQYDPPFGLPLCQQREAPLPLSLGWEAYSSPLIPQGEGPFNSADQTSASEHTDVPAGPWARGQRRLPPEPRPLWLCF